MKLSRCFVLIIAFLAQIVGCSLTRSANGPVKGNLDRAGAAQLIKSSEGFTIPRTLRLEMKHRGGGCEYQRGFPLLLQQMGLVSLTTTRGRTIFEGDSCDAELTEEGRRQSSQWKLEPGQSGYDGPAWIIPIANRELVEITGLIGGDKEQAEVEYTWKWAPSVLGQKLPRYGTRIALDEGQGQYLDLEPEKGRATLRKYDDGWRMTN